MKKTILIQPIQFISIILLSFLICQSVTAQKIADKKEKTKAISLSVIVSDENGKGIPYAQVIVGEGMIHTQTNSQGEISFKALSNDIVTISAQGFEKEVMPVSNMLRNKNVILKKAKLFMTSDDNIPLPFLTLKKRNLTGSENIINGELLEKYPSTDLRNSLTGLATGLDVIERFGTTGISAEEKLGSFGATEKVSFSLRGRSPIFIIDDVPTDITEMPLDPQEIASVTVLKDVVAKSLFGPQAADGAIFIKTKRGNPNDRVLSVNIESGVSTIDRMPEFVSGADYASLKNLARTNSGLTPLYTDEDIAAYVQNNPYDMYHPSNNFRKMMLKNSKSIQRVNLSSSGGSESVQYFANLAYDGDGDIYKIGPTANFNRISSRANLDIKVNDLINVKFNFYGGLSFRESPNYGYNSNYGADNSNDATLDIVELDRVLDDINTISPIAFPVYAKNDETISRPWYGVSSSFTNNPIGRLMEEGYYTETVRSGNLSLLLDYNLNNILNGLRSKSFINYQTLNSLRIGKATEYTAYNVVPTLTPDGNDTITLSLARSSVDMSGQAKLHDYYYHRFAAYENLSYNRSFGVHDFQSMLNFFISKSVYNGIEEPRRLLNGMWNGNYTYNDKYIVQGVINYAGTYSFSRGKRFKAFPSVGLAWVISEENFMQKQKVFNYLKLHVDAGELGYENFMTPFLYNTVFSYNTSGSKFGPSPTTIWFGSNEDKYGYQTYPSRTGNPNLTWETRKEFSAGVDALMLDHSLSFEINYYNNKRDGIITQLSYTVPYMAGVSGAKPYYNYNATRYFGLEMGLQYTHHAGGFKYTLGGNATIQNSKILKIDEPSYRYAYQHHVGKPADSYYGQTYLGQFATDDETLVTPQLFDAQLHAGDFKYKDMNGDGVVDDNDQSKIGHTTPRLFYALNARLNYKNFDLTIIGTGRAFYNIAQTNIYFWNGWGENNYSKFVKEHNGGSYPKLTYYKVNNNYQASSFWLTSGNFFKIQNVELAYTLSAKQAYALHTHGVRIFVRGANLLTLSKLKDVDPENIGSGIDSYPLFRTFTGGINLTF